MTNLDQARAYVTTAPLAVSGQCGHNTTFKVACTLVHGFGLSEADTRSLMAEYNERLEDQWHPRELRHKVTDACNTHSSMPTGYLLRRYEPYRPTPPAPPPDRTAWKIIPKTAPDPRPPADLRPPDYPSAAPMAIIPIPHSQ